MPLFVFCDLLFYLSIEIFFKFQFLYRFHIIFTFIFNLSSRFRSRLDFKFNSNNFFDSVYLQFWIPVSLLEVEMFALHCITTKTLKLLLRFRFCGLHTIIVTIIGLSWYQNATSQKRCAAICITYFIGLIEINHCGTQHN